jgi:hypothetical protein
VIQAWPRRAQLSLASLLAFCVSLGLAMVTYGGGSWLHPHAPAHLFFENFWCDLLRDPSLNGRPNALSVRFGTVGFAAVAVALGTFWLEVAELLPAGRRRFVRRAGLVSAACTGLVALLPSDRFPSVHAPAVLSAGGFGLACGCVVAGWALAHRRQVPAFASVSLLLVLAATVNMVLYVSDAYFHAVETIALPAAQKVATLALVLWLVLGLKISADRPTP